MTFKSITHTGDNLIVVFSSKSNGIFAEFDVAIPFSDGLDMTLDDIIALAKSKISKEFPQP